MTDLFASRASLLAEACDRDLGDPDLWFEPDGYPDSLALCIIDSIYSTGAHYTSVRNVIDRYRTYRSIQGGEPNTDGVDELLKTIGDLGGPDPWATRIGNRRPTSTAANAPLKAQAINQAATALRRLSIKSADDLRAAATNEALEEAKAAWLAIPGQRSGITWEYALMLAHMPGVKADRMVTRYTAQAIGADVPLSPTAAAQLVKCVAETKGWNIIHLDHAIWRYESGRPVNAEE